MNEQLIQSNSQRMIMIFPSNSVVERINRVVGDDGMIEYDWATADGNPIFVFDTWERFTFDEDWNRIEIDNE